jgi:hypothetical protein
MLGEACEDRRRLCAKPFWTALGFAPGGHGGAIEGAEGCGHLVMGELECKCERCQVYTLKPLPEVFLSILLPFAPWEAIRFV